MRPAWSALYKRQRRVPLHAVTLSYRRKAMIRFVDDPSARPAWGYVFVCQSKRCLDERMAELKTLEQKFPSYKYSYKTQQVDGKYVIRLISISVR